MYYIVSDLMYDNPDMDMVEAIQQAYDISTGIECLTYGDDVEDTES